MSKRKQQEKQLNAKQKAHEKKEAQQGEKVVKWIFAALVALGFCFMLYSVWQNA